MRKKDRGVSFVLKLCALPRAFFFLWLQAPSVTSTHYRYDKQLARVYTRPVYHEFRERFLSSTAFSVRPDPIKPNYFLVSHTRPPVEFLWLQHEYSVKAIVDRDNPEQSVFECECMRLEHTGAFKKR